MRAWLPSRRSTAHQRGARVMRREGQVRSGSSTRICSWKGRYLWIGMPEGCCGASPAVPTTGAAGSASAATAGAEVIVESVIRGSFSLGCRSPGNASAAAGSRRSGPVAAAKQEQRSTHGRHGSTADGSDRPCSRYERRGAGPTSEPQPPQLLGIALPLLGDLDPQVQMDLAAQQAVDLGTGPRPDLPQPRAAPADDDPLLAVALDEQRRTH